MHVIYVQFSAAVVCFLVLHVLAPHVSLSTLLRLCTAYTRINERTWSVLQSAGGHLARPGAALAAAHPACGAFANAINCRRQSPVLHLAIFPVRSRKGARGQSNR